MAIQKITSGIIQDGAIVAADIVSIANTQITGNIVSSQITSVANTQITGNIVSSQITSVANTQITGNITAAQITSVANTQITGNIIATQITSVANTQITGNLTATNISGGSNGTIPYQSAAGTTQMLAVGTAGQVLQTNGAGAPTWVAAGGGSWTYLSTVTAAGSATVDIETTINSTYDNYAIVASNIFPGTNAVTPYFRMKVDGAYATGASDYTYALSHPTGATYSGAGDSAGVTQIAVGRDQYTTAVVGDLECMAFVLYLFIPSNTTRAKTISWQGGQYGGLNANTIALSGFGVINKTSAVTGVRFYFGTGTVSTGTFRLYGIKNS